MAVPIRGFVEFEVFSDIVQILNSDNVTLCVWDNHAF